MLQYYNQNDIILYMEKDKSITMKKNIIILLVIVIAIISAFAYNFYNYKAQELETARKNKEYESFYEQEVLGTDLMSLINKAIDSNRKNNVEKDENGRYIDNSKNSIKIEIKFLELDKTILMEAVSRSRL